MKNVRQDLIDSGLCRNEVNKRTGRIVRIFKWAVENELVPPAVHHGLRAVSGLRRGRCNVPESEPVSPVLEAFVDAVQPFVSRQVWAMIQLQRLTGMRPGEVCSIRTCDLDTSAEKWTYTPATHKTEHHGRKRIIPLGPKAQEILNPWLRPVPAEYLFSPREAMQGRWEERRKTRKTPVQPSQRQRTRKARPKRVPGNSYDPRAYLHAVRYGCRRAAVPMWHPNQLRHNAATFFRREYGLDVARAILGHSSPVVTEVYAELDMAKAAKGCDR